jgi:hypothetical protein
MPYDAESVWELVQTHRGYISVRAYGEYRFWIHSQYEVMLLLAFPALTRQPLLDYI